MKPFAIVLLSAALSTAGATVAVLALASEPAPPSERPAPPPAELLELRAALEAQGRSLAELGRKLELRAPEPVAARAPAEELEAVVRRVLEEQRAPDARAAEAKVAGGKTAVEAGGKFSVDAAQADIAALLGPDGTWNSVEGWFARQRARGVPSAELVAAFERFAAEHPNDPQAQTALGNAYIQRLQEAKNGMEMGEWAMKADGAYDKALGLDGTNWEARFSKAVSLSFWPPLFGKQGEAIEQFELLREQQGKGPAQKHHAETYVFLGNLYLQQGDADKAKAIWGEGYALFPDHAELGKKTGTGGTY